MTREQARQMLVKIGISEPTDQQISDYLNSINGEVQKEKDASKKYKEDADKLADVQKQLEDLQNANLSDIEKANKATEEALNRVAELEKAQALANSRKTAMENFKITSEQANQVIKDDGSFDYEALGLIISEKEKTASNDAIQKIAGNQDNPGGASGRSDDSQKTEAEKYAESIGKRLAESNKESNAILDSYL